MLLDSRMRSARSLRMRTSLRMKEGGAGMSARVNYSTGIIANYNCVGVDPSPSLLQHVQKLVEHVEKSFL